MALVADADIELRDAMTCILEAKGFRVLAAASAAETIQKALSCDVDIVLLDQNMPQRGDVEVQQALREAGFTAPVIVVSGLGGGDRPVPDRPQETFGADALLAAVGQALADKTAGASPAQPLRARATPTERDPAGRAAGARVARDGCPLVLIVDECRATHRVLSECLQPDFRVVSAFDGLAGLRLLTQLLPDLLIAADRLSPGGGEATLRQIHARCALAGIPLLVLAEDASRVAHLPLPPTQDFVRKPLLPPEVRVRAARLLATKRAHDGAAAAVGSCDPDAVRRAGDLGGRGQTDEVAPKLAPDAQATAELEHRVTGVFLRMLAHELKTPITALHLQLRLLEHKLPAEHAAGLRDGLERVAQSSNRLLQLIDTCIEWDRVDGKRFQWEIDVFDLAQLVSEVIAEFEGRIRRKGIGVEVVVHEGLPALSSDRKLVRLALLHLINGAVQCTDKGSIKVVVDAGERCHRVWVTDAGAPVAKPEQLFAPFCSRIDVSSQAGSGSGLGLYVVRDLARAIHGDVTLHSVTATGNTFVLTFRELLAGTRG